MAPAKDPVKVVSDSFFITAVPGNRKYPAEIRLSPRGRRWLARHLKGRKKVHGEVVITLRLEDPPELTYGPREGEDDAEN